MITFEQAQKLGRGSEIHEDGCRLHVGPRGRKTFFIQRWRVNGRIKLWKKSPNKFKLPIKHGYRSWAVLDEYNSGFFHIAAECPAFKEYVVLQEKGA